MLTVLGRVLDMTIPFSNSSAALVIAHPGHELCVYGWLETVRPQVFVLTDGSGRAGTSRLDSTTKILAQTGARRGTIYGRFTDLNIYRAILDGDFRLFEQLVTELASIGSESSIHSGAVLYPGVVVGERVAIHANAVVGGEGFSFRRSPDGKLHRVRQVGGLVVEDDVEIGACACIDRAALTETRIGRGTKIDKFVFISHNVELGSDCIVLGQSAVAGSTRIGAGSILCMQSGVREHLVLGERTTVLARGFVVGDTPPDSLVAGFPAMPAMSAITPKRFSGVMTSFLPKGNPRLNPSQ